MHKPPKCLFHVFNWPNEFLAYQTVKIATINDWRLGLFYYLVVIFAVAYLVVTIIVNGGYLDKEVWVLVSNIYCSRNFQNYYGNDDGCLYLAPEQIVYPYMGELDSIFITTRIRNATTPPPPQGCDYSAPSSPRCMPPSFSAPQTVSKFHFIANIESMTIEIDHAIRAQFHAFLAPTTFLLKTELNMTGSLAYQCSTANNFKTFDSSYRAAAQQQFNTPLDVVTVGELFSASGCTTSSLSLEGVSKASGANQAAKESWRSSSIIVSYIPAAIEDAEYKITEKIFNSDGSITYIDRHGLRIIFSQTGTIGQFSLTTLLISIVSGSALISIATFIVDFFMIRFVKDRLVFKKLKYESHKMYQADAVFAARAGMGQQLRQRGAGMGSASSEGALSSLAYGDTATAGLIGMGDVRYGGSGGDFTAIPSK
ncbi:cytochrome c oxidase subunit 1 [Irineochytrium annulatum]|nr:cytochrome c oxidase subunit 1 [Irineochytrium annulatum]